MKSAEVVSSAPKADASQKEIEGTEFIDSGASWIEFDEKEDETISNKSGRLDKQEGTLSSDDSVAEFSELQEEDDDPNSVVGHRMEEFDAEEEQVVNVSLEEVDEVVEEEVSVDPEIQRQILNEIAKETVSCGSKIFYFPQVMKSGHPSKIFLNRENSALVNEPDILMKGAFNKWKWKSFTEKLHKTDLYGDWWSCEIHVPREAYEMDFVFFNGGNIYENNDLKDFHIDIDGEMNPSLFEDFLLKEKQKELQRLAEEQAEREWQAEEQRRKEEEIAGKLADRTQAKIEVEKKRQSLYHVMRQAVPSVDNLWYIEPPTFKEKNGIQIFYNRSSRPLAHSNEIWIHGGYNRWSDGPSISKQLSRSDRKDGDWWCAEGNSMLLFSLKNNQMIIQAFVLFSFLSLFHISIRHCDPWTHSLRFEVFKQVKGLLESQ